MNVSLLEKIDAPLDIVLHIFLFVTKTSSSSFTCHCASRVVDAKLKALTVNIIANSFHSVRESFWIDNDMTLRVTFLCKPAVVDIDINVPEVGKAQFLYLICICIDDGLIDIAIVAIPGVPAHGGR